MKKSIFDDQTSKALKQWRKKALHKKGSKGRSTEMRTLGGSSGDSPVHSPLTNGNTIGTGSQQTTATIMTSVDHNDHYDNNRDLLSGP